MTTKLPLRVTKASPGRLEPLLTRILAGLDPNLTIISVRTMAQQVDLTFDQERTVASLAGLFGIVALLLAAVGLYGVTAYTVAQRTSEIGIRMALGADRAKVVRYILRGALIRVVIGLVLGLPLAIAAGRLISSQLYDVFLLGPDRADSGSGCARDLRVRRCHDSGQHRRVYFSHECA
jgi:ABC-type antimicrobial peptide transport system permease subunit